MNLEHLLMSYECLYSLGGSLDIKEMLKIFMRTVVKKTSAIGASAYYKNDYTHIVSLNKKSIDIDLMQCNIDKQNEYFKIRDIDKDNTITCFVFKDIIILLKFKNDSKDIELLANIIFSMADKINSSVEACIAFDEYKTTRTRLELAIAGSNDGLWDWDMKNNSVYFSPRWKEMIGYEEDKIENKFEEWLERVHPEDKEKTLEILNKALESSDGYYESVHRMQHKNGHWVWILDRGKANFDKDGQLERMVGFHTDISMQKEFEEQLEKRVFEETEKNKKKDEILQQQNRLAQLGEMISMIAHQWRQPLSAIASTAITMQLKMRLNRFDLDTKEGIKECFDYFESNLKDIESVVAFLTSTIDDFRNFYRPDKEIIEEQINIPLKKALTLIDAQLKDNDVKLIQDIENDVKVKIYENEIVQVFLNILKNSLDNFIEKNIQDPTIGIQIVQNEQTLSILLWDNGGGIDLKIIDKIFDPYFSTKDEKNGTGLGLYMSKMIIEQHHNGTMNVYNNNDGVVFQINLKL